jgi:hypothetical protein
MNDNPGQYYEDAQNAANELECQRIKVEDCDNVPEVSHFDFFQKLSEDITSSQEPHMSY